MFRRPGVPIGLAVGVIDFCGRVTGDTELLLIGDLATGAKRATRVVPRFRAGGLIGERATGFGLVVVLAAGLIGDLGTAYAREFVYDGY